jgi:hypothetical protein
MAFVRSRLDSFRPPGRRFAGPMFDNHCFVGSAVSPKFVSIRLTVRGHYYVLVFMADKKA